VEVDHVPYLRCFGYLFDRGGQVVAYSGDTTPCEGLNELARESDVLVVECNGRHTPPGVPPTHMDEESVRALQAAHPGVHLVLTHLGQQVDTASMAGVTVPEDFERLTV
jgi:ribonuclease BN (tRNA processing enzyme)